MGCSDMSEGPSANLAHVLVADGVFLPSGTFRVLPPLSEDTLREALRHEVLDLLCSEGVLDTSLASRMIKWRWLAL